MYNVCASAAPGFLVGCPDTVNVAKFASSVSMSAESIVEQQWMSGRQFVLCGSSGS